MVVTVDFAIEATVESFDADEQLEFRTNLASLLSGDTIVAPEDIVLEISGRRRLSRRSLSSITVTASVVTEARGLPWRSSSILEFDPETKVLRLFGSVTATNYTWRVEAID